MSKQELHYQISVRLENIIEMAASTLCQDVFKLYNLGVFEPPNRNPWVSIYKLDARAWRKILANYEVNFTSENEPFKISYFNRKQNKRQKTRVGRFIGKLIKLYSPYKIKEKEIQQISSEICAEFWCQADVKLLKGEDIREFYLTSGISSCMAYEDTQSFLDIYVDNPDVCELASVKDPNNNAARALVWNITNGKSSKKYMDRIYYTSSACEAALLDFRDKCEMGTRRDLNHIRAKVKIKIRPEKNRKWPYIDTLMYVDILDSKTATLSPRSGDFIADSTEGYLPGNEPECINCGQPSESYVNDEYYCEICTNELFTWCEYCENLIDNDNVTHERVGTICNSCRDDMCFECVDCGDYFYNEDGHNSPNGTVCRCCLDNYYFHCNECGELIHVDNENEYNGDSYCSDCFEEIESNEAIVQES